MTGYVIKEISRELEEAFVLCCVVDGGQKKGEMLGWKCRLSKYIFFMDDWLPGLNCFIWSLVICLQSI